MELRNLKGDKNPSRIVLHCSLPEIGTDPASHPHLRPLTPLQPPPSRRASWSSGAHLRPEFCAVPAALQGQHSGKIRFI